MQQPVLPTLIEWADLDAVERNADFVSQLRLKFSYNLKLDKRYRAIALLLADAYYSQAKSGIPHGLETTDLWDLLTDFFKEHFRTTGEGAYAALLEEMEKLTVIERRGTRY